jgi:hypothetical protein
MMKIDADEFFVASSDRLSMILPVAFHLNQNWCYHCHLPGWKHSPCSRHHRHLHNLFVTEIELRAESTLHQQERV